MRRTLIAATAALALAAPLALAAGGTASAANPAPKAPKAPRTPVADFNKDGYADLVIGAPYGTVGGKESAGYVAVVYGSKSGPDHAHPRVIDRGTPGVPGDVAEYDSFGRELAVDDFDGDGYSDLAVGGFTGKAYVLWGSGDGLTGATAELPGTRGDLTSGDFNGDGHRDLVTGAYPANEDEIGGMTVSYGPFTRGGEPAKRDVVTIGAYRGPSQFVAGDMNGDGVDDLVTSHNFEDKAYASKFWKGTRSGISRTSTGLKSSDGGVVADVDGDGYGDFVTRDNGGSNDDNSYEAGTVRVDYGSAAGPAATRTKKITQDSPGVPGVGETGGQGPVEDTSGDQFGADLSAGDVNGDGLADIAVGVPGEDVKAGGKDVEDAGSVVVLKGAKGGLGGAGAQAFTQSTAGVPGASEKDDVFGARVLLSDVNGDKKADLTVAAVGEDATYADSGAVWVFRGAGSGVTTAGIASFGPGVLGAPEKGARFGTELGR
ncbi:FG-GAP-like repeat-containing protein [Streptomyces lasiicapitis]|uniref:FG-GAP-like repeat-containing protein n=1 Tax=Streptomyces lasiicapitis TaxID=1923961 RepID=UPI003665C083